MLYKKDNKDISYEQVVLYVNIGLDNPYYTEVKNVADPDSVSALVNKYSYLGEYVPQDLVKISSKNSEKDTFLRKDIIIMSNQMDRKGQTYILQGRDIVSIRPDWLSIYVAQQHRISILKRQKKISL